MKLNNNTNILYIVKNYSNQGFGGTRRIHGVSKYFESLVGPKLFFLTENMEETQFESIIRIKTPGVFRDKDLNSDSLTFKNKKTSLKLIHKGYFYFIPVAILKTIFLKFDVIFCTSPVFANVQVGYVYKLFHPKSFFIVEYRDLYSLNPSFHKSLTLSIIKYFEYKVLKKADIIIATTKGMQNVINSFNPKAKIRVVQNYISKIDYMDEYETLSFDKTFFHVGYIGSLNIGRDPQEIFKLLSMKIENKPIMFHFVGNSLQQEEYIKSELCSPNITFHGIMKRRDSLGFMKSMDALYLIINPEMKLSDGYGVPGKLFDYIAMNNKLISKKDCFQKIINEIDLSIIEDIEPYVIFSAKENLFLEDLLSEKLSEV